MMGYYDGDWGAGDWLAMSAMMLVFWVSVIALVVWAARSFGSNHESSASRGAGPDDVLAERYARGEIDDEEFNRRRELLHSARGVTR